MKHHKLLVGHFFCGIGGNALGAAAAEAHFGKSSASFENVGGVDIDQDACDDFERLAQAPALCADIRAVTPAMLRRKWGRVAPHFVMSSPPCVGYSGLLSSNRAAESHYIEMNLLYEKALFLLLSTWKKRGPDILFFENVPRITSKTRGGYQMLHERCIPMLQAEGYSVAMGVHDCGEVGGLAQHRERHFLVARHRQACPQAAYQPPSHRVRGCGEVIGPIPIPGDTEAGGAMHSMPGISILNWVRLALIPAGGDYRDLKGILAEGQAKREIHRRIPVTAWDEPSTTVTGPGGSGTGAAIADDRVRFGNVDVVTPWDEGVGTVTGSGRAPSSGGAAAADPRVESWARSGRLAVEDWTQATKTVTGESLPTGSGAGAIADARPYSNLMVVGHMGAPTRAVIGASRVGSGALSVADDRITEWRGMMGVTAFDQPTGTVAGASRVANGRFAVADPRAKGAGKGRWQHTAGVVDWTETAPTITGRASIHSGPFQVADVRFHCDMRAGAYKVMRWQDVAQVVTGSLNIDNGGAAVADPRVREFLSFDPKKALSPSWGIPIIIAADGTWHRPLTTLELAALQGFPITIDGRPLVLAGRSHTRWRKAIGNAVPPPAAWAVAGQFLRCLLVAKVGGAVIDETPYWVSPENPFWTPSAPTYLI